MSRSEIQERGFEDPGNLGPIKTSYLCNLNLAGVSYLSKLIILTGFIITTGFRELKTISIFLIFFIKKKLY